MSNKPKKLYDLPFEQRIRIKYAVFGAMFTGAILFDCLAIASTLIIAVNYEFKVLGIKVVLGDSFIVNNTILYLCFGAECSILSYWFWYSKAKPKRHPELDEEIGLKSDWDKVKKIE